MNTSEIETPYNKLLISNPGFYRYFTNRKNYSLWTYDSSSIPYLIEELVAHAAAGIAIPANSIVENAVNKLPNSLQKYVRLVDKNKRALNAVNIILEPIFNEYDIEVLGEGSHLSPRKQGKHGTPIKITQAIKALHEELYEFLLGSIYKLQVGLNFTRLNSAINYLRETTESSNAKACLSILSGVTATYTNLTIPAIALTPAATKDQMDRFQDFVEDQEYLKLSKNNKNLGIPAYILRAKQISSRIIRKISDTQKNKSLFNITNLGLSGATNLKMPNIETLEKLVPNGYFPPIVPLSVLYDKAFKRWIRKPINIEDALAQVKHKDDDFNDFILNGRFWEGEKWNPYDVPPQPRQSFKGATIIFSSAPFQANSNDLFISQSNA